MRADSAAARQAAFEILLRVETAGAYASILLEQREGDVRDRRDAALLHEVVLGVLRRRAALDAALVQVASRQPQKMDPEVRTALRIGAYALLFLDRVPDFAAVDSAVGLLQGRHRRSRGFANGALRSLARRGRELLPPSPERGDVAGLALAHSHPTWWAERVVKRFGWEAATALLEANNRPADTILRAGEEAARSGELAETLKSDGISTEPCRYVPGALRVVAGGPRGSAALRRGLAWVQDEASQLVPLMFDTRCGPLVADVCAAPGGKSLQLAERLAAGGRLVAVDRHPGRLRRLAANLRRVGARRALPLRADMAAARLPLAGGFDQVLVDAPCSGTGTLRRHPEIRWRLEQSELKLLARRQLSLLANATSLLRPGGTLVYSVCSMEPEEGEQVIDSFLDSHGGFRIDDPRPALPAPAAGLVDERGFLRTSPDCNGLDGFFACRLVREERS